MKGVGRYPASRCTYMWACYRKIHLVVSENKTGHQTTAERDCSIKETMQESRKYAVSAVTKLKMTMQKEIANYKTITGSTLQEGVTLYGSIPNN